MVGRQAARLCSPGGRGIPPALPCTMPWPALACPAPPPPQHAPCSCPCSAAPGSPRGPAGSAGEGGAGCDGLGCRSCLPGGCPRRSAAWPAGSAARRPARPLTQACFTPLPLASSLCVKSTASCGPNTPAGQAVGGRRKQLLEPASRAALGRLSALLHSGLCSTAQAALEQPHTAGARPAAAPAPQKPSQASSRKRSRCEMVKAWMSGTALMPSFLNWRSPKARDTSMRPGEMGGVRGEQVKGRWVTD